MSSGAHEAGKAANPEAAYHLSPLVYFLTWLVVEPMFRLWARLRIGGKEHIPPGGGIMAVSNHQTMIDPFIVAYGFRRNIRYMGKAELFKVRALGWFLSLYGGFSVDRTRRDPQALRTALNILKAQQVLGMFPEGTRSSGSDLNEFHTGAIRIAIKAQVPIIPAGIWGAHKILPRGAAFPRPGKIGLAFGPPISYAHLYDHHPTPAEINAASADLEARILALVDEGERLWQP